MVWRRRKTIWTYASALALWGAFIWPAYTQPSRVFVFSSHGARPYQEVLAGFQGYLDKQGVGVTYETFVLDGDSEKAAQSIALAKKNEPALIYSLGFMATRFIRDGMQDRPILASLVVDLDEFGSGVNTTGVVLSFPPKVQLEWLKRLLPKHTRVGVLYSSEKNQRMVEMAAREADRLGLALFSQKIESPKELPGALRRLSKKVDVIWALADKVILAPQTAKAILLSSFRNRIPVIGPSTPWVKAGALYALDWDYAEIGRQSGELAEKMLKGVPAHQLSPESPRTVLYSLNLRTARHMRLDLSDALVQGAKQVFK